MEPLTAPPTRHDIVPVHLAITAMRDNGYKNAAYAIAELMDNAIQAGAHRVDLIAATRARYAAASTVNQIEQIAVLDDGSGMDAATLRLALQFGNGTRLGATEGMGRFGMGLPSASISQCTRVDVWSWQHGTASALYTYLDLGEIAGGRMTEVPVPTPKAIPSQWHRFIGAPGTSGTLVVWSSLDRLAWQTAGALFRNSEFVVGRMYRRFLDAKRVSLCFHRLDLDHPHEREAPKEMLPNDPGYLMAQTSCPAPYDVTPMFALHSGKLDLTVMHKGAAHTVNVTFSVAREDARRDTRNAGSKPHGKHAKGNIGVSVVRAGRELELDQSWVNGYDPRERWWGVEIAFPPALDELFGVTNNKQSARRLHALSDEDVFEDGEYSPAEDAQMHATNDATHILRKISKHVSENLGVIRTLLKAQADNAERRQAREEARATTQAAPSPERHATDVTEQRIEAGHETQTDRDARLPADERKQIIVAGFTSEGHSVEEAKTFSLAVDENLRFEFATVHSVETSAFFTIEPRGGVLYIKLNVEHPAYKDLVEVLEASHEELSADKLHERLNSARNGLRLVLMAWARYEDETQGDKKQELRRVRGKWGEMAEAFMRRGD